VLSGTNINTVEKSYGAFSTKVYLNLCEKETEAAGVDQYHMVVEFIDTEGNTITVKPVFNTQEGAHHAHFLNDEHAASVLSEQVTAVDAQIQKSVDEVGDVRFVEALKQAAMIEALVLTQAEENPAIMLMLSAGLSPLEIFQMIAGDPETDEDDSDDNAITTLGGFKI